METIRFYKVCDVYGYFSNFAGYAIYINGKLWPTTEHYFQAQKFNNVEYQEEIRKCSSPSQAAKMGRTSAVCPLREDWEQVKDDIMMEALRAKFYQHPNLRKNLISTKHAYLVEHTTKDRYWGDGGNGKGQNKLGILLMKVREELDLQEPDLHCVLPPWVAFNGINSSDLFWNTPRGKGYLVIWKSFLLAYRLSERQWYFKKHIIPETWDQYTSTLLK